MLLHNFAESVRLLQKQEQQIIKLCVAPADCVPTSAGGFLEGDALYGHFVQPQRRYLLGNACVRLRSDFHDFIKPENVSFRRCSEKSTFSGFMKFENHLARPKTAHFQAGTGAEAVKNGHTGLRSYRKASMLIARELRISKQIPALRL